MRENITELWFSWFYKNWEKNAPGDLIEKGLSPSQIAERFVNENHNYILELAKEFDEENYQALNEFMKLSESELHILKYFLKLIKQKKS
tara:strand:- start:52 stop:318 length:267 start_codon:yes stop_codon:yes gene_type:complete